ncbi:phosphatidylserine decarboxylase [Luminiphilus syltensis NOR5-1B]|uniref:phosphatidylserine decarboxylase n=1 Tax=Luminiphilus syltensis NOR5-1B TaxID=565045 RepID=B8KW55_9GAMM|nr:archaetidylserine decarboxylase [Luminiphilus syltensis]EED34588.1 phosphatidylserine decarboxylase [Luminiphilus syltensis NOR5-1B]
MKRLFIGFQALIPQHALSRLIGRLASLERPFWLKNTLIWLFMRQYGVELRDATTENPEAFPTFNAFFTRDLKPDARPPGDSRYLQPADGVLSQRGSIDDGAAIQAKGRHYSIAALLGGSDENGARRFAEGCFATVYLSPRDYHRVHMPISGTLKKTRYIPGHLFSVNDTTANAINNLYARNERLVCFFDTADGELAVVLVGAVIVAGIETVWGGIEEPGGDAPRERRFDAAEAPTLSAGEELGRFFLGSTVVLVTSNPALEWLAQTGQSVRVKAPLAN